MDLKGSNAKIFTTTEYLKCNLLTGVGSVVGELQVNDSIKYMQIKGLPILGEKGKEFIFTTPHHSPLPAAERTRDLFFLGLSISGYHRQRLTESSQGWRRRLLLPPPHRHPHSKARLHHRGSPDSPPAKAPLPKAPRPWPRAPQRMLHAICHQAFGVLPRLPLTPATKRTATAKGRAGHSPPGPGPGPGPRPELGGFTQRPGPEPHSRCALSGAPGLSPLRRTAGARSERRPRRPPPRPAGSSRPPRPARGHPRPPRAPRSHRLLGVDLDLEGLLLKGLQGDLHGAAAQLR